MIDLKRKAAFSLLMKSAPLFKPDKELNPTSDKKNTPTEHGVDKGVVILNDDHPDTIAKNFEQWSRKDCDVKHKYQPCDGWTMFKDGKYQTIDEKTQLWRYISQFTNRCVFQRGKTKERVSVTTKKLTDIARQLSFLNEVYLRPKQAAPCSIDGGLDPNHIIALQNGLLDWRQHPYILHPCNQQYYTLNYLPYSWHGEKDSELWIKFLVDVTNGNEELFDLLQQWAGYCLMKNNQSEQRFMIVYGEAGTGKSVFVDVLTHLLGRENVSAIPLEKFDDPHYVVQTYGKLLNVTDESESLLEEAIETHLKHYTGGTIYTFKRLYQESFTAYPTAKIMIVTNHLPSFKDTSDGVWRRLLIAPFDNIISEEKRDKGLAQKLIATEMPGVLKWALEGARKVEKYGFVIPQVCQQRVEEYRREAIPEYTFFEENFEAGNPDDEEIRVRCDLVRSCYEQWCKAQGIGAKSQKKLAKTFKKLFPLYDRRRGRDGLNLAYFYYGVKLSQDSEYICNGD
jgi:P4 family phage/plasmid primase-like protien